MGALDLPINQASRVHSHLASHFAGAHTGRDECLSSYCMHLATADNASCATCTQVLQPTNSNSKRPKPNRIRPVPKDCLCTDTMVDGCRLSLRAQQQRYKACCQGCERETRQGGCASGGGWRATAGRCSGCRRILRHKVAGRCTGRHTMIASCAAQFRISRFPNSSTKRSQREHMSAVACCLRLQICKKTVNASTIDFAWDAVVISAHQRRNCRQCSSQNSRMSHPLFGLDSHKGRSIAGRLYVER